MRWQCLRPQGSCFQLNGWGAAKRMKRGGATLAYPRNFSRTRNQKAFTPCFFGASRQTTHTDIKKASPYRGLAPCHDEHVRAAFIATGRSRCRVSGRHKHGEWGSARMLKKKVHVRQTRNPRQRQSAREPLVQPGPNKEKTTSLFVSPITWAEAAWCGKTVRGSRAVR